MQHDLATTVVSGFEPDSPLVSVQRHIYNAFITRMQESRVCMFDSTVIHKSIAKYYEAFMAGCVVAADLPFEMEELYRHVLLLGGQLCLSCTSECTAVLSCPAELRKLCLPAKPISRLCQLDTSAVLGSPCGCVCTGTSSLCCHKMPPWTWSQTR